MAHNINFNEQKEQYSFFSVKQKAWHGLGQIVSDYPTIKEAIKFAGLDYTVEKRELFIYDNENQKEVLGKEMKNAEIKIPNHLATIRTDNQQVLGSGGKRL